MPPTPESRDSSIEGILADAGAVQPPADPAADDAPTTVEPKPEGRKPEAGEARDKPPWWLAHRLQPIRAKQDEFRKELASVRAEIQEMRRQAAAPKTSESIDREMESLRKAARENPEQVVDVAERIAELKARKIAEAQAQEMAAADSFRQEQMLWLDRAVELWPDVRDSQTPLAQLAASKWQEAEEARIGGRWSPSMLPNGRYLIIAEAVAELGAAARYKEPAGERVERRRVALEAGSPAAGGAGPNVASARRELFATRDRAKAQAARSVVIDQLIPENLREK